MSSDLGAIAKNVAHSVARGAEKGGKAIVEHYKSIGENLLKSNGLYKDMEADAKKNAENIGRSTLKDAEHGAEKDAGQAARDAGGHGSPEGVPGASTKPGAGDGVPNRPSGGDPVDLATGDVLFSETDVALPGVLPLVLERAHRSSMSTGRWFGPSWMSSLDQRLVVTAERVIGAFADGRVLSWPRPDGSGEGAVVPASGSLWQLRHHPDGSYSVHDPQQGLTWRFEPHDGYGGDAELPLVAVTDRIGHEVAFGYGAAGRPLRVTHSGGYRVLVTVADERVTGLTLAGRDGEEDVPLRQFTYDGDGNLSGVVNSSGLPVRFTYDDAGRLTSWADRNGYFYRYAYDGQGRCVSGEGPDGMMSGAFAYEPGITRWTSAAGAVTTYETTESGEVSAIISPLGDAVRLEYDSRGQVTTQIDPLGRITRYAYDRQGNLTTVTGPDGAQVTSEYDERCLPVLVTGPDGATVRQAYDERGNLTALTAPDGAVTRFGYDEHGHLASVSRLGMVMTITCDAVGVPTEVTSQDGARERYETDQAGRPSRVTALDGTVTSLAWTPDGKLASIAFPDGVTKTFERDDDGNVVREVSPTGAVTRYEYGPFSTITAMTGPDGTRSEWTYDQDMRVTAVRHGGLEWRYAYDPAGQLIAQTDYNGATTSYTRDAAGQLTRQVNAAGQEITYEYDEAGNQVSQTTGDAVASFGYDLASRLIWARSPGADLRFDRDVLGQVTAETCNGRTITTAYDEAGRVIGRTTPSGRTTSWEAGPSGELTTMTAAGHRLRFGYNLAGQETSRELPGGLTLAQEWDKFGRLSIQTLTAPGSLLQRRSYGYRPDGRLTSIEDLLTGNRAISLDPSGRVKAVSGPDWAESYSYDPAGNITDASWPSAPGPWLDSGAQGQREITGTIAARAGNIRYRHDAAGRVISRAKTRVSRKPDTWRYTWDAEDRLTAVTVPDGTTWHYAYDPLGRRIAKRHLSKDRELLDETLFAWDGAVLAEQTTTISGDDGDARRVTTWDYEPGTFIPVTQTEGSISDDAPQHEIDQRFYSIITDLVGTPTELLAPDGTISGRQRHTLWGGTTWGSDGASTPLRFPGQYEDPETGLHYNNQRFYDPVTGSYLSSDPLGLAPAPNPRAYAPNPHAVIDPLGLAPPPRAQRGFDPSTFDPRPYHAQLPPYIKGDPKLGATHGIGVGGGNQYKVTSGNKIKDAQLIQQAKQRLQRNGDPRGHVWGNAHHAEPKFVSHMATNNIDTAHIVINNPDGPCSHVDLSCDDKLDKLLGDKKLTVHWKDEHGQWWHAEYGGCGR